MSKALELRKKRADLWEKAKLFLDNAKRNGDVMSADDTATYENMEKEIVALGKEIGIVERREALELEMSNPTTKPIANAPAKPNGGKTGRATDEYKNAFWTAMRNKTPHFDVFDALQIGTDSEGGFLVPDEFESTLIDRLHDENIIRSLATVILSSSGDKKIPVVAGHGEAVWTDEEAAFTESDDSFGVVTLGAHKLSSIIKVSEELLNDAAFDIEGYISNEFVRRMAAAEENAFINGDGTGRPTGLISTAETGVTATAANAITADELINLYHSLRSPYRKNAVFIANDSTIKTIRQLKDLNGVYLWQPGLKEGQPDTLIGNKIYSSSYMPEIGAGKAPLVFGDMSYYWIADRQGRIFQRLNELYAATGQIGFRTYQRVDGKLTLPEAVKTLKMKSS
ncbi:MAG: phage major capsid protein [Ruminococcus sp.]|nr:phage major capsid protein [Ruminococcus sp.]